MKMVQGCLGGLFVLGVRAPALPSVGDLISSLSGLDESTGVGVEGSGGTDFRPSGVLAPPWAESRSTLSLSDLSARSLSFLSFLSFFLALSFSFLSLYVAPLTLFPDDGLSAVVAVPELAGDDAAGGGVDAVDFDARCGGRGRSGTGVDPFVAP